MSLILKQESSANVPTPPAGKGTLFLNASDQVVVKDATGNTQTFPTVTTSNTQIVYNANGSLAGSANLTFDGSNLATTGIKTDNLYYANGNPWDLDNPGGSNQAVQFNDSESFGGSANFTWNNSTELLTVSNLTVTGTLIAGDIAVSSIANGTSNVDIVGVSGNVTVSVAGNANILTVTGTGANVSGTLDVSGNLTAANANLGNVVTGNYFTGVLTYAAQPNITSVGTLTSLYVGATSSNVDFANAKSISSQDNVGNSASDNIGLVGEGVADGTNTSVTGIGLLGHARVANGTKATGVQGQAFVTNTADTGAAVGIRGYAVDTHSGGYNIGILGNAMGSGVGNYAFYIQNGGIASIENATFWDLTDNSNAALTFNSTGKANIFGIETTDNAEGIFTSGYLNVVGNISANGIKTNNYYYANGSPVDFQQAAGSNTQLQYNDNNDFGASANLTFNSITNVLTVGGNVSAGNVSATDISATTLGGSLTTASQPNITSVGTLGSLAVTANVTAGNVYANSGTVGASLLTGTLTTAAQPNITSVGTLTSATITGNVTAGNVYANSGTIGANVVTGNAVGGTLTTAAQPNITSVGTLTSLTVTGNVAGGNLNTAGKVVASSLESNVTTGTAPLAVVSTTRVANLNVSYANVSDFGVVTAQSTGTYYPTFVNGSSSANYALAANSGFSANIANGGLTATTFIGNLSGNVNGQLANGTSALSIPSSGGNVNISAAGNANVLVVTGTGANVAGTLDVTGNITGANLVTGGVLSVTGNANVGNIGAAAGVFTGNISANNLTTTNKVTAGNGLQVSAGTLTVTNGNLDVTGNINVTGNLNYSNVTDLVVGDPLIYIGANNTGDLYDLGIVASYNNGTYYHTGIARNASNDYWTFFDGVVAEPTTVIDWANATYPTVKLGNLIATGTANITGNANVGNIGATGVVATTLGGTLTTASQPNITSVGTLTSLAVTGTTTSGNIYANSGTIGASLLTGTLTTAAQPNVTSVGTLTSLGVSGNITAANITANSGVFAGNGSSLTALNASNISTGTLAQARLANASLTVNGTSITLGGSGTITANTTQTLTFGSYLTGTSFNGGTANTIAVDATSANTASKVVARDSSGNFSAGTITATLSGAATTSGTVTTAAQPNITSVGTLTSLTVTGNVTAGNLSVSTGTVTLGTLTTGGNTTAGTVTGNWTLSAGSRWNATYADLAEKYVADATYEPGTVLIFGGVHEVTLADEFDSTRVAGVVSTDPAFSMNTACEGQHIAEIALQGRVPCKVAGKVNKGDLMVTGANGHAIANNIARAGTIIGKALQNFDGDTGIIEVAVGRF
jgi:hypothetical protein